MEKHIRHRCVHDTFHSLISVQILFIGFRNHFIEFIETTSLDLETTSLNSLKPHHSLNLKIYLHLAIPSFGKLQ